MSRQKVDDMFIEVIKGADVEIHDPATSELMQALMSSFGAEKHAPPHVPPVKERH